MKSHKDLIFWKESIELVVDIYSLTMKFPKNEAFVLTQQMRRAAVSIPSNIAEGAARNSKKEFIKFIGYSLGSLAELETQCCISEKLGYFDDSEVQIKIDLIRKKGLGLLRKLKNELGIT